MRGEDIERRHESVGNCTRNFPGEPDFHVRNTAVAALASGVSMIVLPKHRWYGVAIGLNIVAALLGALSVAMLFTARDGHPPAADLLAILSAAICGATIPLGLSEGRQNSH
jgi:hypothetical protein